MPSLVKFICSLVFQWDGTPLWKVRNCSKSVRLREVSVLLIPHPPPPFHSPVPAQFHLCLSLPSSVSQITIEVSLPSGFWRDPVTGATRRKREGGRRECPSLASSLLQHRFPGLATSLPDNKPRTIAPPALCQGSSNTAGQEKARPPLMLVPGYPSIPVDLLRYPS